MHLLDGLFNVFKQWLATAHTVPRGHYTQRSSLTASRAVCVLCRWLTVREMQALGAVFSLVIYYCVGVPLGFWLVRARVELGTVRCTLTHASHATRGLT